MIGILTSFSLFMLIVGSIVTSIDTKTFIGGWMIGLGIFTSGLVVQNFYDRIGGKR